MTSEIKLFNYGDNAVRTIEKDGEVWFVAKDVCDILEIKNSRDAISVLDDDEKLTSEIPTPSNGGHSKINFISESGLYALIFRSNKPEAKNFARWVRKDVLTAIRKHGMYISDGLMEQIIDNPVVFEQVAVGYINSRLPASDKNSLMVLGYAVHLNRTLFIVKEAANILRQFGLQIGEYKLWRMLREDGFACRHKGKRLNVPTQKGLDCGILATAYTGRKPLTMMSMTGIRHYAQKLVLRDFPLLAS